MSTRREDDSRPRGKVTSQRTTARDVPLAKYKDIQIGTSPPGALRGPSLLPGQGAPERIVPEEIELAVLRDAETLDGPNIARIAARQQPDPSASPSPMPVSVEVPRARSLPPLDDRFSTPPSPSARSIQSGTLISVGSVDPRAPTELSLPSPLPLSVSERAAYFGPESVVDRSSPPSLEPRSLPSAVSAARPMRPSLGPDTVSPPAQHFPRAPRSDAMLSLTTEPPIRRPSSADPAREAGSRRADYAAPSVLELGTRLQIHSEIAGLQPQNTDDSFDLRSASTVREPLAGRKAAPSDDWLDISADGSALPVVEARSPSNRSRTAAITLLVDHAPEGPDSKAAPDRRPAVPLSWLVMASLALLAALTAIWIAHVRASPSADSPEPRAPSSAPSAVSSSTPFGSHAAAPQEAGSSAAPAKASLRSLSPAAKVPMTAGSHSVDRSARATAPTASAAPPEASSKSHQSIY